MSIIYCEKHDLKWDSDNQDECPMCACDFPERTGLPLPHQISSTAIKIADDILRGGHDPRFVSSEILVLAKEYESVCTQLAEKEAARLSVQPMSERERKLADAIIAMAEDGWLLHGEEGMTDAQNICLKAYILVKKEDVK